MEKNRTIIIATGVSLAVAVIVLIALLFSQHHQMSEMVEAMEFEKEQLQEEYEDLAVQFDGYQGTMEVRNDSLADLLSQEQQRVQDLLEELRITKVTNARKIAELKRELATVREVMKGYVLQIDSLNRTNQRLVAENREYRRQYEKVEEQARELKKQEKELKAVVNRASMLEVASFQCTPMNKHDRKTRILTHITKLQFDYTFAKNVTAKPGFKTIYLRVINPAGELLCPDSTATMTFERKKVLYSSSHTIEYDGEVFSDRQYLEWTQPLNKGIYNCDIFVDEQMIASFPFTLE